MDSSLLLGLTNLENICFAILHTPLLYMSRWLTSRLLFYTSLVGYIYTTHFTSLLVGSGMWLLIFVLFSVGRPLYNELIFLLMEDISLSCISIRDITVVSNSPFLLNWSKMSTVLSDNCFPSDDSCIDKIWYGLSQMGKVWYWSILPVLIPLIFCRVIRSIIYTFLAWCPYCS